MQTFLIPYLFIFVLLLGCESHNDAKHEPSIKGAIEDSTSWYDDQSKTIRTTKISLSSSPSRSLCAPHSDPTAKLRPCTLEDIENDTDAFDNYKPELSVVFSSSNFFNADEATNAILKQKGKSTRSAAQKSYKIKLDTTAGLYEEQRRLQYNKQFFDFTRIRNKLSFDLFKDIPNITSLKTEFIHLYIDGEDRGLYTKVESYDKEYLLNRGWHKDDNLYKAQNFLFYNESDLSLDKDGKPLNRVAFEKIIEPQRGDDQRKLLEMLRAVADRDIDIDTTISKYFNRENYLTWMAINFIMGNIDTTSQNFFLLNPLYSDTFYFLPWDYDDAWGWDQQLDQFSTPYYADWERGMARYWGSPLHKRFLSKKKNRDDLDLKIKSLRKNYLTDKKIEKRVDDYKDLVKSIIFSSPDKENLPHGSSGKTSNDEWEDECTALVSIIEKNLKYYDDEKGKPMPYWQAFEYKNDEMRLIWGSSKDFEGDAVSYSIKLGTDVNLTSSLDVNESDLTIDSSKLSITSYGEISYSFKPASSYKTGDILYMKVIAKDSAGHTQEAFDKVQDNDNIHLFYYGVFEIKIK